MYKTKLLNQLDSLELEEINQGIAELENNIGKPTLEIHSMKN